MIKLPQNFEKRMQEQLGDEYADFKASYLQANHLGLRVNTLKISVEEFLEIFPYTLEPVPWCSEGFYYREEDPVTKHPYFYAGLYYIQEPSAMSAVKALDPSPGDVCLDLCSAPGGKSTQIIAQMKDDGLLVANDIHGKRIKAVLKNLEKFGVREILVINHSPEAIIPIFRHFFNKLLVDAPCSGEGMFKKDDQAIAAWENFGPEQCATMQDEILKCIPHLMNKKAQMIYSTCTFSPLENERQIEKLCSENEVHLRDLNLNGLEQEGPFIKIWPHRHRGEGHFLAGMENHAEEGERGIEKRPKNKPPEALEKFLSVHVTSHRLEGFYEEIKGRIYLRPSVDLPLKGLHVVRSGLLMGEMKGARFVPSQAFAMFLKANEFEPLCQLSSKEHQVFKYLKGDTLELDVETEGLHLICVDSYPLGWGKITKGVLKNMYPVSWRML